MINLNLATPFLTILSIIGTILSGAVLGFTVAGLITVKRIRNKIKNEFDLNICGVEEHQKRTLTRYVTSCENELEKRLRKSIKEKKRSFFRKKWNEYKADKRKNTPIEPPDEVIEPQPLSFDAQIWYPVYLMLHNIAVFYNGEQPLSFLELNQDQVFRLIRKIVNSVNKLLDKVNIDHVKTIKCSVVLETLNIVKAILAPLSNQEVKTALNYSKQGFTDFMRIKNFFSLNPFYYLKRFIRRSITTDIVIECVKCAVDVIAVELIDVYSSTQTQKE